MNLKKNTPLVRLALSMGDPLGIGPELLQKVLPKFLGLAEFQIFGDKNYLSTLTSQGLVALTDLPPRSQVSIEQAGQASIAYLDAAMAAYHRGDIDALVTAPIAKSHVQAAGFAFPGHTEYLAHHTQVKNFAMMMSGPRLKVTLVTIHEPLQKVASLLSVEKIFQSIELTYQALQKHFALKKPRLAVCALNPHAGEKGLFGDEELRYISPAIDLARQQGYPCEGPCVPDAVFHEAYEGKWDAIVCMYHDQGLIPFKLVHFWEGVNVTLGLPLIRTSPDHGTAFDIAGQGIADTRSMEAAIQLAIQFASHSI